MDNKKIKGKDILIYLILASVLFAAGVFFMTALQGYDTMGFASFALGLLVLVYLGLRLLGGKNSKLAKVLRGIVNGGMILLVIVFAITEGVLINGSKGDVSTKADYLIVLGAGVSGSEPSVSLTERLKAALTYLEEHPDTVCIVSGCQGDGEDITEAECMRRWLADKGITPERIVKEEQARNTYENMAYSFEIIASRGDGGTARIAVLTSEYHLYRAKLIARNMGTEVSGVAAKTANPFLRANYTMREALALWKYLIFG